MPPVIAYSFRLDWNADTTRANEFYQLLKHDLSLREAAIPFMTREAIEANEQLWREYLEAPTLARAAFAFRQWPEPGTTATGGWVKTTWEQGNPYNTLCPRDPQTGNRSLVGCVATALAQVLHYHKFLGDVRFDEQDAYVTSTRGIAVDADNAAYDFPSFDRLNVRLYSLRAKYDRGASLADRDRAALSFASAVAVEMDFTSSASGPSMDALVHAFVEKFGSHSATIRKQLQAKKPTDDVYYAVQENIMNMLPVILETGESAMYRLHAIVCDGYNSDHFYHLNFGWGSGSPRDIAVPGMPSRTACRRK